MLREQHGRAVRRARRRILKRRENQRAFRDGKAEHLDVVVHGLVEAVGEVVGAASRSPMEIPWTAGTARGRPASIAAVRLRERPPADDAPGGGLRRLLSGDRVAALPGGELVGIRLASNVLRFRGVGR
jgi:hypothetical protein